MKKKLYSYLVSYLFTNEVSCELMNGQIHTYTNSGTGCAFVDLSYKIETVKDIKETEKFLSDKLSIENLKKITINSFNLLKN